MLALFIDDFQNNKRMSLSTMYVTISNLWLPIMATKNFVQKLYKIYTKIIKNTKFVYILYTKIVQIKILYEIMNECTKNVHHISTNILTKNVQTVQKLYKV